MIEDTRNEAERLLEDDVESILDTVRDTALELLESLPEHPERIRVGVGDVTVDLDWRLPAAPRTASPSHAPTPTDARPVETAAQPVNPPAGQPQDPTAQEDVLTLHYFCAPSVGTFYSAPEPGASPFVVTGAIVSTGQQVAIIELMKLMLPVEADRPGRVIEVLAEDGQSVEFGDRLIALEPSGIG